MSTRKKVLAFGMMSLLGAALLFAQSRPTGFRSILIKTPASLNGSLDVPFEIDLGTSQTTNPINVKNSAGTSVFKVDSTGLLTATGGQGQISATPFTHVYSGAGAPGTTTTGTDTAGINGTVWISELDLDTNVTITGLSYLIGSVGGTDKAIVFLFDSAGNVLANSALAGTTVGTTATMQRIPFTAPFAAKGPGLYFVGVQTNGTTAKVRTATFGDKSTTSVAQVFGTPAAITPPTTFTASVGPIVMTY